MKAHFASMAGLIVLASALVAGDQSRDASTGLGAAQKLQQAIDLIESKGDVTRAVPLLEDASKSTDRALAARALLYLGQVHERRGLDQARRTYERIIRDYSAQAEIVTQARARLAALRDSTPARDVSGGPAVRRLIADANDVRAISRDGRLAALQRYIEGQWFVEIQDLLTGRNVRVRARGAGPGLLTYGPMLWSRDGKQLAYTWTGPNIDLRIVNADGSRERQVFRSAADVRYIEPFDWTADGKQILADVYHADGRIDLTLFTTADGATRVLKTTRWSNLARLSPDDRWIAYATRPGPTPAFDIYLMDSRGAQETTLVQHLANDIVLGWSPDGSRLFFSSDRSGSIDVWRQAIKNGQADGQPELVRRGLGDAYPMSIGQDGRLFYKTSMTGNTVSVVGLDRASGAFTGPPVPVATRHAMATMHGVWSPDGRRMAYVVRSATEPANTIAVLSPETGEERDIRLPLMTINGPIRWTPDASALLLCGLTADSAELSKRADGHLYRLPLDTARLELLVRSDGKGSVVFPALSPDGKTLYYKRDRAVRTRAVDAETERVLYREPEGQLIDDVALSPRGDRLLILNRRGRQATVVILPVQDGDARVIQEFTTYDPETGSRHRSAWSADGRYVLFPKRTSGNADDELWRVPADGGAAERIGTVRAGEYIRTVSAHPDGLQLAITTSPPERAEIWVMDNLFAAAKPVAATRR